MTDPTVKILSIDHRESKASNLPGVDDGSRDFIDHELANWCTRDPKHQTCPELTMDQLAYTTIAFAEVDN